MVFPTIWSMTIVHLHSEGAFLCNMYDTNHPLVAEEEKFDLNAILSEVNESKKILFFKTLIWLVFIT
jgi:hypothetical protein